MYGFRKGKDENGCDVFRHDIFLKGKKDNLILIKRNRKNNKSNEVANGLLQVKNIKEIYNKMILIKSEQSSLEHIVKELEYKSERLDFTTQIILNSFYIR